MSIWNQYPYTDFHELNLDWIIMKIREVTKEMNDFKVINKITFFGNWDITKQYPAWSVVNNNGDGYISIKPVPSGVDIANTDYWILVANYSALYADLQNRVNALENANIIIDGEIDNINDKIDKMGIINVKDFGAVGDGVTDDTQAINDAINAIDNARVLYFPKGQYVISNGIEIDKKCIICGSGMDNSIIKYDGSGNALSLKANYSKISNLGLIGNAQGIGLLIEAFFAVVDSVLITKFDTNIYIHNSVGVNVLNSYITTPSTTGIDINNEVSPDSGDHSIIGCTLDSSNDTSTAIRVQRGGGLKMTSNKLLSHNIGLDINSHTSTSVLNVDNNSFEGQHIHIRCGSNDGSFSKGLINSNEFAGSDTIAIQLIDGTSHFVIADNVFEGVATGSCLSLSNCSYVKISGNNIKNYGRDIQTLTSIPGLSVSDNDFHDSTVINAVVSLSGDPYPSFKETLSKRLNGAFISADLLTLALQTGAACEVSIHSYGSVSGYGIVDAYYKVIISYNGATYNKKVLINENVYPVTLTFSESNGIFNVSAPSGTGMTLMNDITVTGIPTSLVK